ncbi:MAG: UDP-N-acetylmuramoyl-L-alanine--D-glutamate ligase [Endomicrobiales bacterium]|nr:UDP-N-acetylmuramoyl-L-alanine--D-glutamate ligase [Endomicrobiales bacterium]
MKKKILHGLKVGVIGLARTGVAAANLAKTLGGDVFVSEISSVGKCKRYLSMLNKDIEREFGKHSPRLLDMDLIIKSPGVPNDTNILKKIRNKKIPIWSEIELASRAVNSERIIGITGTNGKTTTTTLVGQIFRNAKKKIVVVGNIGKPFSEVVKYINSNTNVILELSSYQLEDSPSFHPDISCILNIEKDHMEHHHSMKNYVEAKTKIFNNQKKDDYCILNYDDSICRRLMKRNPASVVAFSRKKRLRRGAFLADNGIVFRFRSRKFSFPANLRIPGLHNLENALAAVAISTIAGIRADIVKKTILNFKGVEHRLESVAKIGGVRYINDSKSTNVNSTKVALESFSEPLWLILGGRDKGFPYIPLRPLIKQKVKGVLMIGEASKKIRRDLKNTSKLVDCKKLEVAVKKAASLSKRGDAVLLSPACASFDQFKNFEERGRRFKELVNKIK